MNRAFAVATLSLFVACGFFPGRHHSAIEGAAGEDLTPFLRGVRNDAIFSDHPALRSTSFYRLELSVNDDLSQVSGVETVRYTNGGSTPLDRLDLVLLPNIVAGSMRIDRVSVEGTELPADITPDGMVLRISFPQSLEPGESTRFSVRYVLTVPLSTAVGFGGLETHGGILSLAYAYPMIPASGRWNYGKPPAYGDLTVNPVSLYEVEISYPRDLTLAAPGTVIRHRERAGRASDLIVLGPARDFYLELGRGLEAVSIRSDGVELRALVPPASRSGAQAVLETAARALSLYERLFGPYAYRSLTFVSTRFGALGLEFPGIIVLSSPLYGDGATTIEGTPVRVLREATVAHEVAHQWFYALVGNDQLAEPWIDESFAQYATLRYYLDRYGERGAQGFLRSLRSRGERTNIQALPIGGPVSSYTRKQYGPVIYGRGPLFLRALSQRMGSAVFDGFLKRLIDEYSWKTISGEEIRLAAEKSCGCSVDELWHQWVTPAMEPLPAAEPTLSAPTAMR